MTITNVPQQVTATGVDTFTDQASGAVMLRVYDTHPEHPGDHVAVDITMAPDVIAETIAVLADALSGNAAYGALAERIRDWFES